MTDDHRDAHCEADDGVAYHDPFILHCGFDGGPAAHQEAGHEQNHEKPDGSRKENRELGHFNLRCLPWPETGELNNSGRILNWSHPRHLR
jgi:hypothetical protein